MKYMPKRFDVFEDIDDFFTRPMNTLTSFMKTDVHEKDGYYNLEVELPGYKKEDVDLQISNGYLTIKAEHNMTNEEKDAKGNLVRQERQFGSCSRTFYVGDSIKGEDVKAKFNNGILEITVPSQETKQIESSQKVEIL